MEDSFLSMHRKWIGDQEGIINVKKAMDKVLPERSLASKEKDVRVGRNKKKYNLSTSIGPETQIAGF